MTTLIDRPAKVLVAYYSATGHVHALAKAVADGALDAGAEVRVRHVAELAPEMLISQNQAWGRHRSEVDAEPTAALADLEWADGVAFGSPTRFGNVAAQLKMFLDQAGELWEHGKLINKVVTSFTSSQTDHGGQESTILALNNTFYHWGRDRAAAGLHGARGLRRGRQPVWRLVHQRHEGRAARPQDACVGGRPGEATCAGLAGHRIRSAAGAARRAPRVFRAWERRRAPGRDVTRMNDRRRRSGRHELVIVATILFVTINVAQRTGC
jgi:NAD(P)H dehydrogenase (quinone)